MMHHTSDAIIKCTCGAIATSVVSTCVFPVELVNTCDHEKFHDKKLGYEWRSLSIALDDHIKG